MCGSVCLLRVQCEYYKVRLCLGTNGVLFVGDVNCGAGIHELKLGHLLIALQKDTLRAATVSVGCRVSFII